MQQRKLGTQGLAVSAIGLGCMGMSHAYGLRDEPESIATLHRALDLGIDFFDTSDIYGPHTNEELVGRTLGPHRDKVVIATKFGILPNADGTRRTNSSPAYVRAACDASLKRLGIDTIDLYYQHRVDPQTPIEETVGAMADLVQAGKVRYLGLSEAGPKTIRRAHAVHPISALQSEYSLWSRDHEEDGVLSVVRELGIGLVAYSPLGRGFLTGQIRKPEDLVATDWRHTNPRFQGENFQKNLDLVAKIEEFAKKKQATPSQVALAWVLAQGDDIVPIPGTKRRSYLEENVAAAEIKLTPEELAALDDIAPKGVAQGERYTPEMMSMLNL